MVGQIFLGGSILKGGPVTVTGDTELSVRIGYSYQRETLFGVFKCIIAIDGIKCELFTSPLSNIIAGSAPGSLRPG